ncbi:hypothetical protein SARC_06230 [Sphaeroforma arctica JP610]|uniref:Uncharacterized protein n=1 Tax=Sphaeroforma arctica JP610 TaxID=667725 RepID=A0A0L0FY03_9EUKA|nr:hypothetical protein SARC_06230 [Sphaeroforma arctica JP610]KNC81441.1 hypothetical protein SARC_06230 [Sphaeroforma arctica JP610]|eukprot:XP_014155343.1 hypothetical protein SARC_06230 [Sphaeroforma arctica JP610]
MMMLSYLRKLSSVKVMVESLHKRLADLTTQLEKSREFVATLEMEVSDREANLVKMREDAFADGEQRRVLEQEKSAIEYDLSQQKALVASLETQMSLKGTELEQMQLMLSEKDRTVAITSENMREQAILLQTNAKGTASLQSEYDLLTQVQCGQSISQIFFLPPIIQTACAIYVCIVELYLHIDISV